MIRENTNFKKMASHGMLAGNQRDQYAAERSENPLAPGQWIQPASSQPTAAAHVQQAFREKVHTREVRTKITDGVATATDQHAASMMFKKKAAKDENLQGNMKIAKIAGGVGVVALLAICLMVASSIGADAPESARAALADGNSTTAAEPAAIPDVDAVPAPPTAPAEQSTWVLQGGSSSSNQPGIYTEPGLWPGSRSSATTWTVTHGTFTELFMFGGVGCDHDTTGEGACGDFNFVQQPGISEPASGDGRGCTRPSHSLSCHTEPPAASHACVSDADYLNDVWRFDEQAWSWLGGSQISGPLVYSDRFTYSQLVYSDRQGRASQGWLFNCTGGPGGCGWPGVRASGAAWVDPGQSVWLFGGETYVDTDNSERSTMRFLNDLWSISLSQLRRSSGSDQRVQWTLGHFCMTTTSPCPKFNTVEHNDRGVYQLDGRSTWPGARGGAAVFTNPSQPGQTYLFGGWGVIGPQFGQTTVGGFPPHCH